MPVKLGAQAVRSRDAEYAKTRVIAAAAATVGNTMVY